MLQQVMTRPGEIEFQDVAIPGVAENQVLIRVMRIGVCGSDIHVYHGEHPFTRYPVTQGHEISGEIVKIGARVEGLLVGQRVTVEPQLVCGKCHPCRNGKYNLCEKLRVMGFQSTGLASQFFAVDEKKVTPLPDDMSFDEGALIEPLAVAVHAVRQMGSVRGMKVAVLGAGPIGNLVAQAAKGMGAQSVLITDVSDFRLQKARECGVSHTVNTRTRDFGKALTEAFGPDRADVIYDCAGNDVTMGQAIAHARKGSDIVLVAVFADRAKIDLAVLNDHELTLKSSMMYRHEDYVGAIELVQAGRVKLRPLITKHFAFEEYLDAYRFIDKNRETTLKVLIDIN